ncbi:heavy-metal-associated domain-containing protein [Polaribacter sp. 11A2H]|uniref:heavy-metal-associated domain-containing protein n=1 Tax=Polaribacter sp. 11A2H TaxID=2687290 RepID=UPI00140C68BB|nr:heavy-metal-associated domain-containing protein [Polaribacter sp. 11A2H]
MSLITKNVITGNHGKVFETNAKENHDLEKIKDKLSSLDGIKDVIINAEVFPKEFTVHTTELVNIKEIESVVKSLGFHAIPKTPFSL